MTYKKPKEEKLLTEFDASKILDAVYRKALDGIPSVSPSIDEFVEEYASRYGTPEKAANALVRNQILKCGAPGFLSGVGGIITLPVVVPANIANVMYVQLRMIAAVAKMGGFNVSDDHVQTMVFACLTGTSLADVVKDAGVTTGVKTLTAAIKKIPEGVLKKINGKMGFRFITKFGEKGVINLGKMVPLAGCVIGGGMDVVSTTVIGYSAIKMFIRGEEGESSASREVDAIKIKAVLIDEDEFI